MIKVCFVVASPMTAKAFLPGHMRALCAAGFAVSLVANTKDRDLLFRVGIDAPVFPVAIERRISPWRDLCAAWNLWRLFRRERFDLVHSLSPKAGLLCMAASWMGGIQIRVHTFTGQVWATRRGLSRLFLRKMDRIIAALATHVLVDSESQRQFLVTNRVVSPSKSFVLARGSVCGVDTERFHPDSVARIRVRDGLGISESTVLVMDVGRLNRDKGVLDLAEAFMRLAPSLTEVHLLFVGPDEEQMRPKIEQRLRSCLRRLHMVDYTDRPQDYMAAADVFCLPSYREGFGQVIVEAAAAGIPAVASRIYGVTDAVADGETGLLYPPGDVATLANCLEKLIRDSGRRKRMGTAARVRVLQYFTETVVSEGLVAYYRQMTKS